MTTEKSNEIGTEAVDRRKEEGEGEEEGKGSG